MKNVFGLGLIIALAGCVTVTETAGNATQSDPTEMAEARIALGLGYLENGSMIKARENLEKSTTACAGLLPLTTFNGALL